VQKPKDDIIQGKKLHKNPIIDFLVLVERISQIEIFDIYESEPGLPDDIYFHTKIPILVFFEDFGIENVCIFYSRWVF
jgi:hypothetical protein